MTDVPDITGRMVVTEAVPEGTIVLVSPRQATRVRTPDGREVERAESLESWARRCAVVRTDDGPLTGEVGWYLPDGAERCPRCKDINYDESTRRCITCTDGDDAYADGRFRNGWRST